MSVMHFTVLHIYIGQTSFSDYSGNTAISEIAGESGYSSGSPSDQQSCSSDEQLDEFTMPAGCICGDCRLYTLCKRSYSNPGTLPIQNGTSIADKYIEVSFGGLVTDTSSSFAGRVTKDQIVLYLKQISLFSNGMEEVCMAENMEQLFVVLSDYWSWYNISLLEILINKFGKRQDKERLKGYHKECASF